MAAQLGAPSPSKEFTRRRSSPRPAPRRGILLVRRFVFIPFRRRRSLRRRVAPERARHGGVHRSLARLDRRFDLLPGREGYPLAGNLARFQRRTRARATEHGRAERLRVTRPHVPRIVVRVFIGITNRLCVRTVDGGRRSVPRALARAKKRVGVCLCLCRRRGGSRDTSTVTEPASRAVTVEVFAVPARRRRARRRIARSRHRDGARLVRGNSVVRARRVERLFAAPILNLAASRLLRRNRQTRHVHRRAVCRRRDVRVAGAKDGDPRSRRAARGRRRRSKPRAPGAETDGRRARRW